MSRNPTSLSTFLEDPSWSHKIRPRIPWETLVGRDLASVSSMEVGKNGDLFVTATSREVLRELEKVRVRVLHMCRALGVGEIALHFRVGVLQPTPVREEGEYRVHRPRPSTPGIQRKDREEIESLCEIVEDIELRAHLVRFLGWEEPGRRGEQ